MRMEEFKMVADQHLKLSNMKHEANPYIKSYAQSVEKRELQYGFYGEFEMGQCEPVSEILGRTHKKTIEKSKMAADGHDKEAHI